MPEALTTEVVEGLLANLGGVFWALESFILKNVLFSRGLSLYPQI